MNCRESLGEKDNDGENLYGTGTMGKGFDSEYVDTYIDTRHSS
jgi:hypothetical protein